jgi:hypothetical protein
MEQSILELHWKYAGLIILSTQQELKILKKL